ncbi:NAD(+) diphosphatase [Leucobacter chromiireducens]|uniref:NAD(+) diphosphatase n=1 Tax=Leucobacter chromiireducens subsp. chromiireducens TaxID=660067 RepID=A0ABS1SMM9_9MICO|nr:NAD(+) diphosphatase [Leucobacter chromiireducens]MBL3689399.1 NAD(+) diphosphatase [Leucobacter chromiireducens subsp. chromiireducens]
MNTQDRPPLASGVLDRDAATRETPELLRAAWNEPGARLLQLRGIEVPVTGPDAAPRLALVPTHGEPNLTGTAVGHVYLGRMAGAPVFACATAAEENPETTDERAADAETAVRWRHPFAASGDLGDTERELVAVSSALLRWHEAAEFSPRDGEPTEVVLGGWGRRDAHGGELFPRTDPAVIVLIEHEDRILLGSNALWESGRFSLLAGFVEAGEALEQTVAREVFEEAGVQVANIEYVASQPWPFPRSLMLGFRATLADGADPDALQPDPAEISELRWFSREQLRNPDPGIILPQSVSIARWLIDRWLAEVPAGDARANAAVSDDLDGRPGGR